MDHAKSLQIEITLQPRPDESFTYVRSLGQLRDTVCKINNMQNGECSIPEVHSCIPVRFLLSCQSLQFMVSEYLVAKRLVLGLPCLIYGRAVPVCMLH